MPEQRKENKKARTAANNFAGVPVNPVKPAPKEAPFVNVKPARPLKPEEWQSPAQANADKLLAKWFSRKTK